MRASDAYVAPGKASPGLDYGYLMSLWESAENFDRDKRRRAFTTSMSKEETIVSIRSRRADIAYFYVVVDLHRDEREI